MSDTHTTHAAASHATDMTALVFESCGNPAARQTSEWIDNQQFVTMLDAFRTSGGLARAQEVAALCQSHGGTQVSSLANWIIKRKVISFEWQGKIWLPLFQFNPVDMTLQPGLAQALSELVVVYDDWDVANWFSQPNVWLADGTPADTLARAASEVLNAARAERYVEAG